MDATGRLSWRLDSTRTPGLHTGMACAVPSCARGCGLLYLLSAEGDNNQFPYKDDAHRSSCVGSPGLWRLSGRHAMEPVIVNAVSPQGFAPLANL